MHTGITAGCCCSPGTMDTKLTTSPRKVSKKLKPVSLD